MSRQQRREKTIALHLNKIKKDVCLSLTFKKLFKKCLRREILMMKATKTQRSKNLMLECFTMKFILSYRSRTCGWSMILSIAEKWIRLRLKHSWLICCKPTANLHQMLIFSMFSLMILILKKLVQWAAPKCLSLWLNTFSLQVSNNTHQKEALLFEINYMYSFII